MNGGDNDGRSGAAHKRSEHMCGVWVFKKGVMSLELKSNKLFKKKKPNNITMI